MKFKIALPLLVGLIIVLGTVGIVSAQYIINRNIVATVLDPIDVSPNGDVPVTIYRGASVQVPFQCTNNTGSVANVTVSYGVNNTPPPGMSISLDIVSFTLAVGEVRTVTATIFADASSVNSTITIHFTTG